VPAAVRNRDVGDDQVPSQIEIRLLGPIELWRDGRAVAIGGRRQRSLLALLAIDVGRPIPAGRLIDEIWAGDPPEGAATTLKVYASRLRSTLGRSADLESVQSGYRLQVPPDSIDALRFERLLHAARQQLVANRARRAAELAGEAIGLWRGPAFGGLSDAGILRVQAERVEELRLEAIEVRIEAELATGQSSELVADLEALVAEHPFRERLWRDLMLALYRSGRQADALAAYHRARRVLDDELGVEPGPDLAELEASILRHEVPPRRSCQARTTCRCR